MLAHSKNQKLVLEDKVGDDLKPICNWNSPMMHNSGEKDI